MKPACLVTVAALYSLAGMLAGCNGLSLTLRKTGAWTQGDVTVELVQNEEGRANKRPWKYTNQITVSQHSGDSSAIVTTHEVNDRERALIDETVNCPRGIKVEVANHPFPGTPHVESNSDGAITTTTITFPALANQGTTDFSYRLVDTGGCRGSSFGTPSADIPTPSS